MNDLSETPRTDANYLWSPGGDIVDADFARELEREIQELQAWKQSALQVMNQTDLQAVGRELGLTLGTDVSPNILPGIQKLKERIAELEASAKHAWPREVQEHYERLEAAYGRDKLKWQKVESENTKLREAQDRLMSAADEWAAYVIEDTAPMTLGKYLEQALAGKDTE